jgi:glutathione S-transferase
MITLYTFPEAFGLRNVSPFCLKVEMALAHLGMDSEIVFEPNPAKAPKGKLPMVVIDGEKIPDSEIILERLDQMSNGGLYGSLTAEERARGTAWTRLIEDHLYWIGVASRWLDDDWFPNIVKGFFHFVPAPVRPIATFFAKRGVRQTYHLHGLGRHSMEEQKDFARRDLQAISDAVGESSYILGEQMTAYDYTVASLLAGMLDNQPPTWFTGVIEEFPRLRAYAERVQSATGIYCRAMPAEAVAA